MKELRSVDDIERELANQLDANSRALMSKVNIELEERIKTLSKDKDFKYIRKFFDDLYFRMKNFRDFRPFVKRFGGLYELESFFDYNSDAVQKIYPINDRYRESSTTRVKSFVVNDYTSIAKTIGCAIYTIIVNDIPSVMKRVDKKYDIKPYAVFNQDDNYMTTVNTDDILHAIKSTHLTYECKLLTFYDQIMQVVNKESRHVNIQRHKVEICSLFGHNYVSWGDFIKLTTEQCLNYEVRKTRERNEKEFARVNRELDHYNKVRQDKHYDDLMDKPKEINHWIDCIHRSSIDTINRILSDRNAPYRYDYYGVGYAYVADEKPWRL